MLRPFLFNQLRRRTFHATSSTARRRPTPGTPSVEQAVLNILHNSPETKQPTHGTRLILSCLAHNEPGVISRVSSILQSRSFNIESLVAAHTEIPNLSRMTVALNGDEKQLEYARSELEDLVPMWAVLDYTHTKLVERELLLLRVSIAGPEAHRPRFTMSDQYTEEVWEQDNDDDDDDNEEQDNDDDMASASEKLRRQSAHLRGLTELARLFEGRILDVSSDSILIELCAKPYRITSFIKLCKPFGIIEASRTGVMALPRSPLHDDSKSREGGEDDELYDEVDATTLPPG